MLIAISNAYYLDNFGINTPTRVLRDIFAVRNPSKVLRDVLFVLSLANFAVLIPSKVL